MLMCPSWRPAADLHTGASSSPFQTAVPSWGRRWLQFRVLCTQKRDCGSKKVTTGAVTLLRPKKQFWLGDGGISSSLFFFPFSWGATVLYNPWCAPLSPLRTAVPCRGEIDSNSKYFFLNNRDCVSKMGKRGTVALFGQKQFWLADGGLSSALFVFIFFSAEDLPLGPPLSPFTTAVPFSGELDSTSNFFFSKKTGLRFKKN